MRSARDFQSVSKALLATLASGLADHWTDAHQEAWTAAWGIIVAQIIVVAFMPSARPELQKPG